MYKCIQTITKSQWVRVREPLELLSAFVNEFWLNDAGDGVCTEAWTCKGGDEEVGWEMKNRPAEGCECDSEERVVRVGVNRWIMMIQFNQHLRWRANYVSKNCHIPSASHAMRLPSTGEVLRERSVRVEITGRYSIKNRPINKNEFAVVFKEHVKWITFFVLFCF